MNAVANGLYHLAIIHAFIHYYIHGMYIPHYSTLYGTCDTNCMGVSTCIHVHMGVSCIMYTRTLHSLRSSLMYVMDCTILLEEKTAVSRSVAVCDNIIIMYVWRWFVCSLETGRLPNTLAEYVIDIVEFTLHSMFILINLIFTTQSYLYVETLEVFCNEAL